MARLNVEAHWRQLLAMFGSGDVGAQVEIVEAELLSSGSTGPECESRSGFDFEVGALVVWV